MDILKYRKIYYLFSGVLVGASIVALFTFGLPLGIDFTGGSLLEIEFEEERLPKEEIGSALQEVGISEYVLQATGEKGYIMRFPPVDEITHQNILTRIREGEGFATTSPSEQNIFTEKRFDFIGPVIGEALKKKAVTALWMVLAGILLYVAWAFRRTRGFVSGWRYSAITLITLSHDVLVTVGFFTVAGFIWNFEANISFVAAVLLVLGYSVTDTVVVFDRIRENIMKRKENDFYPIVEKSIVQTLVRSFNTSFTTLLVVLAIFFFGGETLKSFAATLAVGIAVGTYSSIFLASPLLYSTHQMRLDRIIMTIIKKGRKRRGRG